MLLLLSLYNQITAFGFGHKVIRTIQAVNIWSPLQMDGCQCLDLLLQGDWEKHLGNLFGQHLAHETMLFRFV